MDLLSLLSGFVVGGLVVGGFVVWAFFRWSHASRRTAGSVTIENVACINGDTEIEVSFSITGDVVDLCIATYDSTSDPEPTWDQATPVGSTTSPIVWSYDPFTCHDTVVLFAMSASGPADGAIDCVASSCSGGGASSPNVEKSSTSSILP